MENWEFSTLEQKADGPLVAYIPFWRYAIFGVLYAIAFCILITSFIYLCRELPPGFLHHWNQVATSAVVVLLIAVAMPFFAYQLLKGGYKKVQFDLDKCRIRYLKSGIRGGILLSDNYGSIALRDITDMELGSGLFGGGVVTVKTSSQIHSVILLLSPAKQAICYRALKEAVTNRQEDPGVSV
jgi:hypothetical protein